MQWIREFLGKRDSEAEMPESPPSAEQIATLIGKITEEEGTDNLILTKLKNALDDETEISENHESTLLALGLLEEGGADNLTAEESKEGRDSDSSGTATESGRLNGEAGPATPDDQKSDERTVSGKISCCPYSVKRNIVKSIEEIERFAQEHELAAEMLKAVLTALAEITLSAMRGKVNGAILLLILNALNFNKAKERAYKEGELAGRNSRIEEKYFPQNDDGLPHFNGMKERTGEIGIFNLARKA